MGRLTCMQQRYIVKFDLHEVAVNGKFDIHEQAVNGKVDLHEVAVVLCPPEGVALLLLCRLLLHLVLNLAKINPIRASWYRISAYLLDLKSSFVR